MAAANPVIDDVLRTAAQRMHATPHGGRRAIAIEAAERTGLSIATVYRRLTALLPRTSTVSASGEIRAGRKQRSDAGSSALTADEARIISTYLSETVRGTEKQLAALQNAVTELRTNGLINAGRVNPDTGEFIPMSVSAINRALKVHRFHPDQLRQPAPKVELASEHPNHAWQIDPSLCVLYYLKREAGLRVMPANEFYDGKPKNLARIANERVWRYVHVDHATGAFYVEYVLGAESGQNLCDTFIAAMQPRGAHDPFHGVPRMVMVDPGSANTGAMFNNLCDALGVAVWINQPGQPWAKGSVEKHNDIIEREFEHRLRFHRVGSLAELNAAAWRWMRGFNARAIHTRTQTTRYAAWMTIKPDQLRIAPEAAVCRRLAVAAPEERTVNVFLRVSYRGAQYDVSSVPGVIVGQKLRLTRCAWSDDDSAHVLGVDADGRRTHYVVPRLARGAYGFTEGSVTIGDYRAHAATPADVNRAAVERTAMSAATDAEAAERRKAKALPFDGQLDPYRGLEAMPEVAHLPRAGTPISVDAPVIVDGPTTDVAAMLSRQRDTVYLTTIEAALRLRAIVGSAGGTWSPDYLPRIETRFAGRVPEDQLSDIAAWLAERPTNVRAIGGAV